MTKTECAALYRSAHEAGEAAAAEKTPTPMVVGTPKDLMGSLTGGDGGGFSETEPVYYVPSGVCGFASVIVRPGTTTFAKYLKAKHGAYKSYYGGTELPIRGYGQSMEKKEAYAGGFAKVLGEAGLKASVSSRLD